jgi:hypothetical protein
MVLFHLLTEPLHLGILLFTLSSRFGCTEDILEAHVDPHTPNPTRVLRIVKRLRQFVMLPRDCTGTQIYLLLHLQLFKKLNKTQD